MLVLGGGRFLVSEVPLYVRAQQAGNLLDHHCTRVDKAQGSTSGSRGLPSGGAGVMPPPTSCTPLMRPPHIPVKRDVMGLVYLQR